MADKKVYEIEATITLRYNFEVDANNESTADIAARGLLDQQMAQLSRGLYDTYDIDIEQITESEGH